jgi:16S rRNA G1207 methylase RsmC
MHGFVAEHVVTNPKLHEDSDAEDAELVQSAAAHLVHTNGAAASVYARRRWQQAVI